MVFPAQEVNRCVEPIALIPASVELVIKLSPAKFFFAFHSLKTLIKVEKLRDQTDKLIKLLKRVNMRAYYF